jgi:phosphoglycerol transferase MdoB-like AlkP superfamily enzyme
MGFFLVIWNYIKKIISKIPYFIKFVTGLYIICLAVLFLLRVFLLLYVTDLGKEFFSVHVFNVFIIGFQFDTVVLSYILAIPLLTLYVYSILSLRNRLILKLISFYLVVILPLLLLLTIADIPYFRFFNNRITEASLQWIGSFDIVMKMVISDNKFLIFLIISIISELLLINFLYKYLKRSLVENDSFKISNISRKIIYTVFFLILTFFCFLGMRGTLSHPIRQGDAFYCNNASLNQIGLNPAFTFIKSYTDKVNLMDNKQALQNTRNLLQITNSINSISEIAREIKCDSSIKKYNIIIVLMESMSANYLGVFGNKDGLTPTLDSLACNSWFFTNAYSAGIHTNNGIFSTLFSFPALRRIRPMSTVPARKFSGFSYTLKQYGYRNLFFCDHSDRFDNIGCFIPENYFDIVYSEKDFPKEKICGPFGVPDDYLFSYSLNVLNKNCSSQPFFATILTSTNHSPYNIPDYFNSSKTDIEQVAVSYADWSIRKFLQAAEKQSWFKNTIIIFVADHGIITGNNPYDLKLSYHHIPIIFYNSLILGSPKIIENYMGQIDIFPTIMGLLNISYINNTLGVNVLSLKRECIYFSSDDKIGCINNKWLYVYRFGGKESLYKYTIGDLTDYSKLNSFELNNLRNYAFSNIQAAEYIISHDKTSLSGK